MTEDGGYRLTRSISVSSSPSSFNRFNVKQRKPQFDNNKNVISHLIPSDLWEAVSGEKVIPSHMGSIQEKYIPMVPGSYTTQQQEHQNAVYVKMAKDRFECVKLQEIMEHANKSELDVIFNALFPHYGELVSDPSANFVLQKECEYLTNEQQYHVLQFFLEDIQKVVEHPTGCRVLQKFIETTSSQNIDKIFNALLPNFFQLCSSQNGNHIAQRFIMFLPERRPQIIAAIKPHVLQLVEDNWGCRVIQRLFENPDIDELVPLVDEVLKEAAKLAENQFGNYVVQNILTSGRPEHIRALINAFKGHFYEFSMHKFASNVIEKCIRNADKEEQQEIFEEIIGYEGHYNRETIYTMISDQFGNYVIQRIIEFGTQKQQDIIADVFYENFDTLIQCNYSKHVIACLEKKDYSFK